MAEYIDREALRLAYEKSLMNNRHRIEGAGAIHIQEHRHILHILEKIPAADVVEVVRCKNCKFSRPLREELRTIYKPGVVECCRALRDEQRPPDHYCPYGERKEQE